MPNYRRARVPGTSYFFTVTLADRRSALLVDRIDLLRLALRHTLAALPCRIDAMVVLPDHLHCIWTQPPGDADFSTRWQRIKARFAYAIRGSESMVWRGLGGSAPNAGVWQRGFWEHLIRNEADYSAHVDYIHYNPVKHGYVGRAAEWQYSSFHRFVNDGIYHVEWGGSGNQHGDFGE